MYLNQLTLPPGNVAWPVALFLCMGLEKHGRPMKRHSFVRPAMPHISPIRHEVARPPYKAQTGSRPNKMGVPLFHPFVSSSLCFLRYMR
jgi:hypothetical protein